MVKREMIPVGVEGFGRGCKSDRRQRTCGATQITVMEEKIDTVTVSKRRILVDRLGQGRVRDDDVRDVSGDQRGQNVLKDVAIAPAAQLLSQRSGSERGEQRPVYWDTVAPQGGIEQRRQRLDATSVFLESLSGIFDPLVVDVPGLSPQVA